MKDNILHPEPQFPVILHAAGTLHEKMVTWKAITESLNIVKVQYGNEVAMQGRKDQQAVQEGQDIDLPILAYYGFHRFWSKYDDIEADEPKSRTAGYQDCLDPTSDQLLFEKWFKRLELSAWQEHKHIGALDAVREAVTACIPGIKGFSYRFDPGKLMMELEHEDYCLFNNLSDGYRSMMAIVADIAHRAARLNPHLGERAAREVTGIVLIDELDLHLHPKWQRYVVRNLKEAFPHIQFMVTTHSPFIIQSLSPGEMIDLKTVDRLEGETPPDYGNFAWPVQPKEHHPDLRLEWNNFLLACKNCNSTKKDKEVVLNEYFWPDQDNTFRAFAYSEGGLIAPSEDLDASQTEKANNTITLTGLDKRPLNNPTASDRRWFNRRETWDIAVRSKERLSRNNTDDFREQIVETATGHAYWSVWMTVFQDDPDMRRRFTHAFKGTATDCFGDDCQPVPRPGGQI